MDMGSATRRDMIEQGPASAAHSVESEHHASSNADEKSDQSAHSSECYHAGRCPHDGIPVASGQQAQASMTNCKTANTADTAIAESSGRGLQDTVLSGAASIAASVAGCVSDLLSALPLPGKHSAHPWIAASSSAIPCEAAGPTQHASTAAASGDNAKHISGTGVNTLQDNEADELIADQKQTTTGSLDACTTSTSSVESHDTDTACASENNQSDAVSQGHSTYSQHAAATISRLQQAAAIAAQHSNTRSTDDTVLSSTSNSPPDILDLTSSCDNHEHDDQHNQHLDEGAMTTATSAHGASYSSEERLQQDRLLVAANAALLSLLDNADTHFAAVNEGAAPALVATLQHGKLAICLR